MRIASLLLATSLVSGGCSTQSYRVSSVELQRLASIRPEDRGRAVRVDQEISESDVPAAQRVDDSTIIIQPGGSINVGPNYNGGGIGHVAHGGGGGFPKFGGGGGDGKGAAIAIIVIAAVALVIVAAIEGARWDGTVQVHPMMPVHLFGRDGEYEVRPLAWLDPQTAQWADHAILRSNEGPWRELDRAPLWRTGMTYSMYAGKATMRSVYGDLANGTAFTIQMGAFITQEIGIQGSIFFGWRDNREGFTMFESRYTLELDYMPITVGPLSIGGYVGGGAAYRFEDSNVTDAGNPPGSWAELAGAMFQLDLHTRIALTARFGIAQAHGEHSTDAMIGLSVY